MSQKQETNRFSEESQQLLVDMNHTEIFELCENSAKLQCRDCNSFTEIGIIYCSCGTVAWQMVSVNINRHRSADIPVIVEKLLRPARARTSTCQFLYPRNEILGCA